MRSGHMPGAVNVPFSKLVSKDDYSVRLSTFNGIRWKAEWELSLPQAFRDLDEIRKAFADASALCCIHYSSVGHGILTGVWPSL
jgi:hypothetical protein